MSQSVLKLLKYFFAFTLCVINASPVSFIQKCHINDNECLLKSTQDAIPIFAAGIPELEVSILDPIYFKKIDGNTPNMNFILKDVHLKGLKGCVPKKIELQDVNDTSKKLSTKATCSVEMDGQYEMKGQLIVPIEGKGKVHAVIKDATFAVSCVLHDKVGKDGKQYLNVKSCSHTHEFTPNSIVHLENLFPNNEILARAAEEVIDTNPDTIVAELGPPIIKSIMEVLIKNIAHFAAKVPYEDLVIVD